MECIKNKKFKFYFFWNIIIPFLKCKLKANHLSNEKLRVFYIRDKIYIDTEKGKRILRTLFTTKILKFNFNIIKRTKKVKKA